MPAVLIISGVSMTSTVLLKKIIIGPVFKKRNHFMLTIPSPAIGIKLNSRSKSRTHYFKMTLTFAPGLLGKLADKS